MKRFAAAILICFSATAFAGINPVKFAQVTIYEDDAITTDCTPAQIRANDTTGTSEQAQFNSLRGALNWISHTTIDYLNTTTGPVEARFITDETRASYARWLAERANSLAHTQNTDTGTNYNAWHFGSSTDASVTDIPFYFGQTGDSSHYLKWSSPDSNNRFEFSHGIEAPSVATPSLLGNRVTINGLVNWQQGLGNDDPVPLTTTTQIINSAIYKKNHIGVLTWNSNLVPLEIYDSASSRTLFTWRVTNDNSPGDRVASFIIGDHDNRMGTQSALFKSNKFLLGYTGVTDTADIQSFGPALIKVEPGDSTGTVILGHPEAGGITYNTPGAFSGMYGLFEKDVHAGKDVYGQAGIVAGHNRQDHWQDGRQVIASGTVGLDGTVAPGKQETSIKTDYMGTNFYNNDGIAEKGYGSHAFRFDSDVYSKTWLLSESGVNTSGPLEEAGNRAFSIAGADMTASGATLNVNRSRVAMLAASGVVTTQSIGLLQTSDLFTTGAGDFASLASRGDLTVFGGIHGNTASLSTPGGDPTLFVEQGGAEAVKIFGHSGPLGTFQIFQQVDGDWTPNVQIDCSGAGYFSSYVDTPGKAFMSATGFDGSNQTLHHDSSGNLFWTDD